MGINPLFDPSTDNQDIHEETQKMINTDMKTDDYAPADQEFVDLILQLVEAGTIQLYQPSSLINHQVYDTLSDEAKGLADLNAMNILAKLRQIVEQSKIYEHPTFQLKSLVASVRQNKERLEEHSGDIYII